MNTASWRVLLVERNEEDYHIIRRIMAGITSPQISLYWVNNYESAYESIAHEQYDVCFLNHDSSEGPGIALLNESIRASRGGTPCILLAKTEDYEVDVAATKAGAADYLLKGHINAPLLERSIRYAIERKKTELALLEAQQFALATVDALLDNIAVLNKTGDVIAMNAAWRNCAASTGFVGSDCAVGANYLEFCEATGSEQGIAVAVGIRAVMAEEKNVFVLEYPCHGPSEHYWFEMRATRFTTLGDSHIVVAHEDITERKRLEAELRQAPIELEERVAKRTIELAQVNEKLRIENIERHMAMRALSDAADFLEKAVEEAKKAKEEADTANQAKSEFLSRMSHELRTPLNAILGFGQILSKQENNEIQKESVHYILHGGRHLLDLINEILDISRVEAGRLELSLEAIGLSDVISETCALVRPLAMDKNISLIFDTLFLKSFYVLADRQRLKQVLMNLLSNAIKYNRADGEVRVLCNVKSNKRICISICDTGLGIAANDMAKLFTPFERLSAANSGIEGSGLGLVLSHHLIEAMGGTLEMKSMVNQGTTLSIELQQIENLSNIPADLTEATSISESQSEWGAEYSILCIEDNISNLQLVRAILQSRPEFTLFAAMQGSIGIDLARQNDPDLILLDLNLPDISGKEVLMRLQQSAITKDIPVIIISADATPTHIEQLLSDGAKDYLTKPFDIDNFLRTLDKVLSEK